MCEMVPISKGRGTRRSLEEIRAFENARTARAQIGAFLGLMKRTRSAMCRVIYGRCGPGMYYRDFSDGRAFYARVAGRGLIENRVLWLEMWADELRLREHPQGRELNAIVGRFGRYAVEFRHIHAPLMRFVAARRAMDARLAAMKAPKLGEIGAEPDPPEARSLPSPEMNEDPLERNITLRVGRMRIPQAIRLQQAIAQVPGVNGVCMEFDRHASLEARFNVSTSLTTNELASTILSGICGMRFSPHSVKPGRIEVFKT
jgi:hypothetical protein